MKILYIEVDALSPGHMSCYGYKRRTTPNIDKLAEEALLFTNMHTSDAPCLPSRTALCTGQFGINSGVVNQGGKYADLASYHKERPFTHPLSDDGLFSIFKRSGITTSLISAFADRQSAWHFYAGFNEIYNYGNPSEQQAPGCYALTKEWLERNRQKDDWFLFVNLWDAHTPYRVPKEYGNPFEKDDDLWITEDILAEHLKMTGPHTARHVNMYWNNDHQNKDYFRAIGKIENMQDVKTVIDGYDVGIHYVDYHIGKILDVLKQQGIYDDVMVVISADHGECMGELGIYSEHGTADDITTKIPYIIKPGDGSSYHGRKYDGLHYSLDVLPTFAQMLGTKPINPATRWHGTSFYPLLKGEVLPKRDYLVVSQMSHVCQRSVIFGDYIYIRTYHDGYHLHFDREMLFNLKEDPHEQKNIAKNNEELLKTGRSYLLEWYDERMDAMIEGNYVDPMRVILAQGGPFHANKEIRFYVDGLIKDGRVEDANRLKARHAGWFDGTY